MTRSCDTPGLAGSFDLPGLAGSPDPPGLAGSFDSPGLGGFFASHGSSESFANPELSGSSDPPEMSGSFDFPGKSSSLDPPGLASYFDSPGQTGSFAPPGQVASVDHPALAPHVQAGTFNSTGLAPFNPPVLTESFSNYSQVNSFQLPHGVNVQWEGSNLLGYGEGRGRGGRGYGGIKKGGIAKKPRGRPPMTQTQREEKKAKDNEVAWRVHHSKTVEYINSLYSLKMMEGKENIDSLKEYREAIFEAGKM